METSARQIRLKTGTTSPNGKSMIWYDQYNLEKMRKLKAFVICSSGELEQVEMPKDKNKVIDNMFQGLNSSYGICGFDVLNYKNVL
ncbi:hypothetical protein [Clostridium saccharoperbutylacetonicum]|uniref:hypothetical protein n=1 Tax=Clostridium saccharoperbutylacetonicum TaxID=36745 RepID=UPI0039E9BB7B